MKKLRNIVISIAIPELVGIFSALLTAGTMDIYDRLRTPAFSPPGWIFAPVWTILFALMGYASYRIWSRRSEADTRSALTFYGVQLIFNFLWSIIFFRFQLRGLAFIEIIVLLILIVITTIKFYKIDRPAGLLLIPYLLWVSFASVLNLSIWLLNR